MAEGVPAVEGHVNPVAEGGTLPVRRLAGAHPEGRRIGRGERDRTDGGGREVVEDGVPGSAVVPGAEQASRGGGRVVLPGAPGHHREVGDPPGHHRGSDGAERQVVQDGQRLVPVGVLGGRRTCQQEAGSQHKSGSVDHWGFSGRVEPGSVWERGLTSPIATRWPEFSNCRGSVSRGDGQLSHDLPASRSRPEVRHFRGFLP